MRIPATPAPLLTLLALGALLAAACGDSTSPVGDEPGPEPLVVGPDGGTLSAEGVTLTFPPGAVDAETEVTVTPGEQAPLTVMGYQRTARPLTITWDGHTRTIWVEEDGWPLRMEREGLAAVETRHIRYRP